MEREVEFTFVERQETVKQVQPSNFSLSLVGIYVPTKGGRRSAKIIDIT